SFSSGGLAAWRWRSESLDAVVANDSCATLSRALPQHGACLARAVQGVSDSGGRAPADGPAVCRAQPAACRPGRDLVRLALDFVDGGPAAGASALVQPGAGRPRSGLAAAR